MVIEGIWGGLYKICVWVMRITYLNILWILFTLLGLCLFGFMPASIALFTVIRKWLLQDTDIPIFNTFFQSFKQDFLKTNLFALIILFIGAILYVDLQYVGSIVESAFYAPLLGLLFLAGILYLLFILYIGPVFVHYDLRFGQYIKYAIMIGITQLHFSLMMIVLLSALYYLTMKFPGIFPFLSISCGGFIIMWSANMAFNALLRTKEKVAGTLKTSKEIKETS
ncbi:YesL family protein [Lederbergia galactosidilytica]|nr:YesL family protein [Lederbergia galactosidilytica]MBP1916159.1 putative membrane protein YesL [Lederbergia galactosidilytica]